MESSSPTLAEALENTDRSLRRLMRYLKDLDLELSDDLQEEIRRSRRQVRSNQEILGESK